jgi:hypothetical protein
VLTRASVDPEPSPGAISSLVEALHRGPAPEDRTRWLTRALRQKTGDVDTHPSLSDRLAALGVDAEVVAAGDGPGFMRAGDFYFDAAWPAFEARLGALWIREARAPWRHRHAGAAHARKRLAELGALGATEPLTPAQSWEQVLIELELESATGDRVVPRLLSFVERVPDHGRARYTLGGTLLERDDPDGVEHVLWACERDPEARGPGYEQLARFYERDGRAQEAEEYRRRSWAAAGEERRYIEPRDELLPHDLSSEEVQALRQHLSALPGVTAVYVARKAVRQLPEKPHYIIGVVLTFPWFWKRSLAEARPLLSRALQESALRGSWQVLCGKLDTPYAWRKLKRVAGAELLRS